MRKPERRIVNTVAAGPGWRAVYQIDGRFVTRDLSSWAFVAGTDDEQHLIGMVTEGEDARFADEPRDRQAQFYGYVAPGAGPEGLQPAPRFSDWSERRRRPQRSGPEETSGKPPASWFG